jgi:hypothetical protein
VGDAAHDPSRPQRLPAVPHADRAARQPELLERRARAGATGLELAPTLVDRRVDRPPLGGEQVVGQLMRRACDRDARGDDRPDYGALPPATQARAEVHTGDANFDTRQSVHRPGLLFW